MVASPPQVREEAGELCQTLEANEGQERAASEAADLIYHAMVLLNAQVEGPAGFAQQGVWGEQSLGMPRNQCFRQGSGHARGTVAAALGGHASQPPSGPCPEALSTAAYATRAQLPAPAAPCSHLALSVQGVSLEEVSKVLRSRFGTSGIEEKAARPPKA